MNKQHLERYQVGLYLAAIGIGLGLGGELSELSGLFELLLWPTLALLLFATFAQVPLARVPSALRDTRFIAAALLGNFVLLPLFVGGLLQLLPPALPMRLGVLLVLLVPCTDWFITFTQLGRGDVERAIVVTPLNLLLQLALLPLYLWLFLGEELGVAFDTAPMAGAVVGTVLLPLLLALIVQRAAAARPQAQLWLDRLGWCPVPLLALAVFLIAASQIHVVRQALPELGLVALAFAGFLIGSAVLGWSLTRLFALAPAAGRTLTFSLGTRNSFMVLPVALALPAGLDIAAVVIVLQSLIELFGMTLYLYGVPRWLIPEPAG